MYISLMVRRKARHTSAHFYYPWLRPRYVSHSCTAFAAGNVEPCMGKRTNVMPAGTTERRSRRSLLLFCRIRVHLRICTRRRFVADVRYQGGKCESFYGFMKLIDDSCVCVACILRDIDTKDVSKIIFPIITYGVEACKEISVYLSITSKNQTINGVKKKSIFLRRYFFRINSRLTRYV